MAKMKDATKTVAVRDADFADLIAPMTPEEFFSEYYDRKPLFIKGSPEKFAGLMEWETLNRLLNMSRIWSPATFRLVIDRKEIPPRQFCSTELNSDKSETLRPDAEKVNALLREGASLAINDIDTLTPELINVADTLERTLHAKVQSNLYYSWRQRQGFFTHYDTHDVYAFHTLGTKRWRVFEGRANHPIQHPRHKIVNEAHGEANRGNLLMDIVMEPGDLLYLPRGQYHDALSVSDGCAHIAFGAAHVIGMDVLGGLSDIAVDHDLFRTNLPLEAEGRDALRKRLADLGRILSEIASSDEFVAAMEHYIASFHYRRGGFDLPVKADEPEFSLSSPELRVETRGGVTGLVGPSGGAPIPPALVEPVRWVVERGSFQRVALAEAFPAASAKDIDRLLADLESMKVIVRSK